MATDPDELSDTSEYEVFVPSVPRKVAVEIAARSEVGKVRAANEDHYLIGRLSRSLEILETNVPGEMLPPMSHEVGYVMVVADGMGGMACGEEASRLAIVTGMQLVRNSARWLMRLGDPDEEAELVEQLRWYFGEVNRSVADRAQSHRGNVGMGTTLTVAYSVGLRLFVVHAGDSRAYVWHSGVLQQITHDHTVAQNLFEMGRIVEDELKTHRFRHVLTNYVGNPSDGIEAEIHQVDLASNDRLLLCSDGLTDLVSDEVIGGVLASSRSPEEATSRLVEAALEAGGRDNVTAVVAFYKPDC